MQKISNNKTIYIIDGYGFIFRAFYAVPNLKTNDGMPIGAVYGFFKMLISLINSSKPEYIVVALDTGKRTFRNDIYDNFLENRSINHLLQVEEYKNKIINSGVSIDDVKNKKGNELVDLFDIDKQKLVQFCDNFGLDLLNPPKLLVLLIFLNLEDNIKIEDYKTQYKANRKQTPDDLKIQFKIIRELIEAMNIKTESCIGYEADDVIASLAKNAVNNGYQAIVVSADKDLCQLVKDNQISVFDPVKKKHLDENGVFEKFGVYPPQVCDYLSIIGDSCDNVFGVNGIGPKGAVKLLQQYGKLENILDNIENLDKKIKDKIIESKEVLQLAHRLIELNFNAIKIENFEKYKININHETHGMFLKKYNFNYLNSKVKTNIHFNSKKDNIKNELCNENILQKDKKTEIENNDIFSQSCQQKNERIDLSVNINKDKKATIKKSRTIEEGDNKIETQIKIKTTLFG